MPGEITHHLAAAGRMADMDRILQVQMLGHSREVVGVMVQVVAVGNLRRAAMAATVMRDDAITLAQEEQHLRVPVVRRKRPAVAEHDRLTRTPVLVENLNTVLGYNLAHATLSLASSRGFIGSASHCFKSNRFSQCDIAVLGASANRSLAACLRAVGLGQDAWRLPAERPLVFADIGRVRGDIMVFGGTVGLVVCGVTAGAGWAMAVGDGLPMARFVGFVADPLTNVWRLRSKRTLTNRCLPISIYEYTA